MTQFSIDQALAFAPVSPASSAVAAFAAGGRPFDDHLKEAARRPAPSDESSSTAGPQSAEPGPQSSTPPYDDAATSQPAATDDTPADADAPPGEDSAVAVAPSSNAGESDDAAEEESGDADESDDQEELAALGAVANAAVRPQDTEHGTALAQALMAEEEPVDLATATPQETVDALSAETEAVLEAGQEDDPNGAEAELRARAREGSGSGGSGEHANPIRALSVEQVGSSALTAQMPVLESKTGASTRRARDGKGTPQGAVPAEAGGSRSAVRPDASSAPSGTLPTRLDLPATTAAGGDGPAASEAPAKTGGDGPASLSSRLQMGPGKAVPREAHVQRTAEIDRVRFIQRVARAFQVADSQGGHVRLRLSPPELGSMRLEIAVRDGVLTAHMETETTEARTLLLEHLPVLRERLAEQNIKLERFNVDLMSGQAGGPSDQPGEHGHWQDRAVRQQARTGSPRPTTVAGEPQPAGSPQVVGATQLNVII